MLRLCDFFTQTFLSLRFQILGNENDQENLRLGKDLVVTFTSMFSGLWETLQQSQTNSSVLSLPP